MLQRYFKQILPLLSISQYFSTNTTIGVSALHLLVWLMNNVYKKTIFISTKVVHLLLRTSENINNLSAKRQRIIINHCGPQISQPAIYLEVNPVFGSLSPKLFRNTKGTLETVTNVQYSGSVSLTSVFCILNTVNTTTQAREKHQSVRLSQ